MVFYLKQPNRLLYEGIRGIDSRTRYLKLAYLELDGHKAHNAPALVLQSASV